ncbi:MAG: hypothetical protein OEZ08_03630 [Betaproteobacteria bacterium]|nr:hypothetical protein [Betaproteobacteria bacterium]
MLEWIRNLFRPARPAGPPRTIRRFGASAQPIARDLVVEDGGWRIEASDARSVQLFEVKDPQIEQCVIIYRAELKSAALEDPGYLEMWCHFPGRGEYFSKGLHHALKGTNDWALFEIPFYLKRGERPDLIKLNLALEGPGNVWIRSVELSYTPLR